MDAPEGLPENTKAPIKSVAASSSQPLPHTADVVSVTVYVPGPRYPYAISAGGSSLSPTCPAATERVAPEKERSVWDDANPTITAKAFDDGTVNVTEADVASGLPPESPSKATKLEYPEISAPTMVYAASPVVKLFELLAVSAISSARYPAASVAECEYTSPD